MHLPLLILHKGLKLIVPAAIVCELACDISPHQVGNHLRWFNLSFSFAWCSEVVIHYIMDCLCLGEHMVSGLCCSLILLNEIELAVVLRIKIAQMAMPLNELLEL